MEKLDFSKIYKPENNNFKKKEFHDTSKKRGRENNHKITQAIDQHFNYYIKGGKQKELLIIGLSIFAIIISLFLFFRGSFNKSTFDPNFIDPDNLILLENI